MKIKLILFAFISTVFPILTFAKAELDYENVFQESFQMIQKIKTKSQIKGMPFITVGSDNFCDIRIGDSKIQDAIDTGIQEVRIASNDTYVENLLINDISVILKGGYADCTAATHDMQTTDVVLIDGIGDPDAPVIKIIGASQRNTLIFENLQLMNGTGTVSYPGGGLSAVGADAEISMNRVFINQNTSATFGGGLAVIIGNTDISMIDSLIFFNEAKTGGGISCIGVENSIVMSGFSGISLNQATATGGVGADGKGGGLYLTTGCQFSLSSGTRDSSFSDLRGIYANYAAAKGGGIYAETGAMVYLRGQEHCIEFNCIGDNINPVNVTDNVAGTAFTGIEGGGGIYATGTDTLVFITGGLMFRNSTGGNGGAIAITALANLIVKRLKSACWIKDKCNLFTGNLSGTNNGIGGAIYNDSATVDVSATYFEHNRADFGTAIFTLGNSSSTRIEGSVFTTNGDNSTGDYLDRFVIRSFDGASTEIVHSTLADNEADISVFGISAGAVSFKLHSSIVHDASSQLVLSSNPGGTVSIDCVMAHETTSISTGTRLLIADPQFIDRGDFFSDYHINSVTSPALDYCDNSIANIENRDVDYEIFGWDDPNVSNIFGPYDIGADETYENDIVFRNGFE